MAVRILIDIRDASGNKLGSGPVTSAESWQSSARMDQVGSFSFRMAASDPQAPQVLAKRYVRCRANIGGSWQEVGQGIIDQVERSIDDQGVVWLTVSGDDLLRELTYRTVGFLSLASSGSMVTHAAAVAAVGALAPAGWTFNADAAPGNNNMYGQFAGESVLAALAMVAQKTQSHFYRTSGRTLNFRTAFTASGVRAIQAKADLSAETCAITELVRLDDSYDLITRVYPFGAGQGQARLSLAATTRTAPSGYTLSTSGNYIDATTAAATYGQIERMVEFKEIAPISNTDGDIQSASNMLFDAALDYLTQRVAPTATYRLKVAECSTVLTPGQVIGVTYRDTAAGLYIDQNFYILEATTVVDALGLRTTELTVRNTPRWPLDDQQMLTDQLAQARMFAAHPQLNANSYVIAYTKSLDDNRNNPAVFRFRFDDEVTQLVAAFFDFQLLPLESTVKTVGLATTVGVDIITSFRGSTPALSDATKNSGAASVTTTPPLSGVNTTSQTGTDTSTQSTTTSGGPSGGDIVSQGKHQHSATVYDISNPSGSPVYYFQLSSVGYLGAMIGTGNGSFVTSQSGDHTHNYAHTHSISHTHDIGHTHGIGHTHDISHTHDIGHGHTFTPSIATAYGVYRDDSANLFSPTDLEYSLDGVTWYLFIVNLNGLKDLGDGWYRIDLTALLQNSSTLRPAANNNKLQFRRNAIGATNKRATIDAQLSIRTIIQAIAYT